MVIITEMTVGVTDEVSTKRSDGQYGSDGRTTGGTVCVKAQLGPGEDANCARDILLAKAFETLRLAMARQGPPAASPDPGSQADASAAAPPIELFHVEVKFPHLDNDAFRAATDKLRALGLWFEGESRRWVGDVPWLLVEELQTWSGEIGASFSVGGKPSADADKDPSVGSRAPPAKDAREVLTEMVPAKPTPKEAVPAKPANGFITLRVAYSKSRFNQALREWGFRSLGAGHWEGRFAPDRAEALLKWASDNEVEMMRVEEVGA